MADGGSGGIRAPVTRRGKEIENKQHLNISKVNVNAQATVTSELQALKLHYQKSLDH